MSWLGEVLFGRRERQPVLVHLSNRVVSGMETLVYLHNSNMNEIDHISIDDIVERSLEITIRKALKIFEEKKPVAVEKDEHFYAWTRGRRQAK